MFNQSEVQSVNLRNLTKQIGDIYIVVMICVLCHVLISFHTLGLSSTAVLVLRVINLREPPATETDRLSTKSRPTARGTSRCSSTARRPSSSRGHSSSSDNGEQRERLEAAKESRQVRCLEARNRGGGWARSWRGRHQGRQRGPEWMKGCGSSSGEEWAEHLTEQGLGGGDQGGVDVGGHLHMLTTTGGSHLRLQYPDHLATATILTAVDTERGSGRIHGQMHLTIDEETDNDLIEVLMIVTNWTLRRIQGPQKESNSSNESHDGFSREHDEVVAQSELGLGMRCELGDVHDHHQDVEERVAARMSLLHGWRSVNCDHRSDNEHLQTNNTVVNENNDYNIVFIKYYVNMKRTLCSK